MSEEKAKELGVAPLATWVAGALAGRGARGHGLNSIAATKKVMAKTGLFTVWLTANEVLLLSPWL